MTHQSADNCPFPPIIELLSIDSTNNYALSLLKPSNLTERQMATHGSAVFAHEQFAGKGQRGKTWHSKAGENIHLSVILMPKKIALSQQFLLSAIVALSVREVFDKYAQSDITIKWPNDIYFSNRKAGGILIENIVAGNEWKWAIAGIGLNINQTQFDAVEGMNPVSLRQITGKHFDCKALASEIRDAVLLKYESYNPKTIIAEYNQFLYKKKETVGFEKDGNLFYGWVKEVLPDGQLTVQTDIELRFTFGEVRWVLE